MTRRLLGPLVATLPLVSACAFLIDFDELQGGNRGGAGGSAGASGSNGAGGTGGAREAGSTSGGASGSDAGDASALCPTGCADTDPCTVDECTPSGCTHTYTPGVSEDGLSETILAPTFHRATIAVWKNRFYLSALKQGASGPDLLLHSFGASEKNLGPGKNLSDFGPASGRLPVSAAGIAAGDSSLFLSVFIAMGPGLGRAAQVWETTFDQNLAVKSSVPVSADDNYAAGPTSYPVAWATSTTEVYAAWPGATSGVFLHRAGSSADPAGTAPTFGPLGGKVSAVAPLLAGSTPGVLYINTKVNVEAQGQSLPIPLGGCDTHPGTFTNAISAFTKIQDVWVGGWTKTLTGGGYVSETKPVLCGLSSSGSNAGCLGAPQCDSSTQTYTGIRDPALSFITKLNDPPGRVYEVITLPYVDTGAKNEAGIGLQMIQIDFDLSSPDASQKATSVTPTTISIAKRKPGPNGEGPDWPALAFMPPDLLGMVWIEPGGSNGQELHVERHRVCFPKK